jgi:hypothetical protein
MASLKRRAFNQYLIERISQHLAKGHRASITVSAIPHGLLHQGKKPQ